MEEDWNLFAEYRRFRQNPVRFVRDFRKMMTGADFAAYQDYLGPRLFDSDWSSKTRKHVLTQPVVTQCIDRQVRLQLDREGLSGAQLQKRDAECRRQINDILNKILDKALPTFQHLSAVRFEYFFISQTLSRAYMQGMHISRSQVDRLRAKALELQKKKQSLVLFPCHKSHVDYIALVYAFFRIGLSMPMTLAGDNLDIPILAWFLRQVGATFIRRGNWKDDPLYTATFQGIINTYLQQGMNIQCFIEGTRSRTGKLLPPRYGILKFICEALLSGAVEDCWIVPISTQYDKVVEADTYATELMGREKKSESLMSFLESRSVVKVNLGRIDVKIGEGFSLRGFLTEQVAALDGNTLGANIKLDAERQAIVLRSLAYRVLADINRVSVVMPSALVGTVLLTTRQRGLSQEDLIYRVRRLIDRVIARGGRVGAITKPASELTTAEIALMVAKAIEVLGSDLVTVETRRLLEPVSYAKDEFKLSYYRNQTIHLFVSEALVCTCLYQHFTQHLKLTIERPKLRRKLLFLSRLLSGEFVFNSSDDGVDEALDLCLAKLKEEQIVEHFDNESVRINPEEVRQDWVFTHFYAYLVWPFIDGYWAAAVSLQLLPHNEPVPTKRFLDSAQQVANTLYLEGALTHVEACNREVILSAVAQAESREFVTRTKTTISRKASLEELTQLSDQIGKYRNEVMKRPSDGALMHRVKDLGRPLIVSARL